MATHSSVLAWRIPETEEPGRRPSMGSHRVGHDWSNLAAYCLPQLPLAPCDYWALEMWVVHSSKCCICKMHIGFWRLSMKKRISNIPWIILILVTCWNNNIFAYIGLSKYIIKKNFSYFSSVATRKFYSMYLACIALLLDGSGLGLMKWW